MNEHHLLITTNGIRHLFLPIYIYTRYSSRGFCTFFIIFLFLILPRFVFSPLVGGFGVSSPVVARRAWQATKYLLRSGQISRAEQTIAIFTRHEGDPQHNLFEMQCRWKRTSERHPSSSPTPLTARVSPRFDTSPDPRKTFCFLYTNETQRD